ncbi:hypothetical protein FA15DRAFT_666878 [Coprinopsis marcescibilis]|uniref:DUF6533 domain-containing protein n=1 Tax=Coprinopsis marcescibilis TaxID=230819 RepID=A0A5C3L2G4_COPMA|nr:hypothetical protein FA15DRAFT_666878 [Coprinopsis marcescibilis]
MASTAFFNAVNIGEVYLQKRTAYSVQVASTTLLAIDWLATLDLEVNYVWPGSWNMIKILFVCARYSAFFHGAFILRYVFAFEGTQQACHIWLGLVGMSTLVSTTFAEAILFIRVYAMAGRNRGMRIYLVVHYVVVHLAQLILMSLAVKNLAFHQSPLPGKLSCVPNVSKITGVCLLAFFGIYVISEIIIVIIMCFVGFQKFRHNKSDLFTILFRDGLIYFAALTGIAIGNIIVILGAPKPYTLLLVELQAVLHTILSTRMVLHIRETDQRLHEQEQQITAARPGEQIGLRKMLASPAKPHPDLGIHTDMTWKAASPQSTYLGNNTVYSNVYDGRS